MALFDEIQARLRKQAQGLAAAPPATGTQAALVDTARAGTGRAGPAGVPRVSNVGEQVQAAAGAAQSAQLAGRVGAAADRLAQQQQTIRAATDAGAEKLAAGDAAFDAQMAGRAAAAATTRQAATESLGASLAGQEARGLKAATAGFAQKSADLASAAQTERDDVFAQFRQGTQELAFRKDSAQLEQIGQQLALRDRAYVDELVRVGTLRRLDNENEWRTELQRLTLGDKLDSWLKQAQFKVDLNADQRTFNEQMASMDSDVAMAVLSSEIRGTNGKTITDGLGKLADTGGKAYVANKDTSDDSAADTHVDVTNDAANYDQYSGVV